MILPGKTAAGSAGRNHAEGHLGWAHRDDHCICANILLALLPTHIGSVEPHALKTNRPKDGIYTTGVLPQFTLRRHICSWRADSSA
jgi:hypothetical protein